VAERSADEYRQQISEYDAKIGVLYRERRAVMEQFAEAFPPSLPPPRYRTETQQRVARCPRCGSKLETSSDVSTL
jgi:chorismate mutase